MENANEILCWNPNDQFKRSKRTFSEELKPSVLIMIKTVDILHVLFGVSSYFVTFVIEWSTIWPPLMTWSTAEILGALWSLKKVLSDIVIDLSYITHKCTTVYVYLRVIG